MNRQRIATSQAPSAIGPYSQAVVAGDLVYVSGQIPLDPASGALIEGNVVAQTDRVMQNLKAILEAAGSSLDKVVKTTVYLADLNDFEEMNGAYGRYFTGDPPARATVGVARLPKGAVLEIDAVAIR
jgi:2-iminobutanoate/2-iminopropanoate deaminase